MSTVSVRGVRKSYGPHPVIHGVDLEIADGEFVVLVGPSGCGKSTLLRMIAGLESITTGEICIGRRVVNDEAPRDRDIAMVFQNYALYPHMSVADNMGFALMLKGVDKAAIGERVQAAASILGLAPLLARYPRELSGGQRQRVAMGRAIVRDPKVFLFDEPLSNLDAKLRVSMRAEMKTLHHRLRTTTVYVTHDQIEAMTLADRIVVMNEGIVQQVGRPLELYDRPANTFVASFIGSPSMNLIEGRLDRAACVLRLPDGGALPLARLPDRPDGHPVTYGVRPEDIHLAEGGLPAELEVFEPTGAEAQAIVRLKDVTLTVILKDRRSYEPGDLLQLSPDIGRVHLFDGASGERLQTCSEPRQ